MASQEELDRNILLGLFPVEIWGKILQHVDLPHYNSVAESSPFVKILLEPLKTQIMFPGVAEILFRRYLKVQDLMLARCVCQAWKKAVDHGLNNWNLTQPHSVHQFKRLPFQVHVVRWSNIFKESSQLVEFMEHFDTSSYSGNPFLTGSVTIAVPTDIDHLPGFYHAFFQFLHKFGHNINNCLLNVPIRDSWELVKFYKQLGTILKLMPNLRRLQFVSGITQTIAMSGMRLLERAMKEHPIPKINQLEHLKQTGLPAAVLYELVQSNQQIKVVESQFHTGRHLQIYLEEMPNLEALAVDMHSLVEFIAFRDARLNCRLTKLNLQLQSLELNWVNIFGMINHHFRDTLEELCLSLPAHDIPRNNWNKFDGLVLPKLRKLAITLLRPSCLDFILPLKGHLEQFLILVYSLECWNQSQIDEIIQFFQPGYSLYQSNMWTLFPKLDKLHAKIWNTPLFEGNRTSWRKLSQKEPLKKCHEYSLW